jgi:adenylate cyclase
LDEHAEGDTYIITVPGRGYRLADPSGSQRAGSCESSTAQPLLLPDKPSIAVLPFQNMSGDTDQLRDKAGTLADDSKPIAPLHADLEPFVDGLTQDIITGLSRIQGLWVIAASTMLTYKKIKAVSVPEIARDLGVRYVLEGSVRKGSNRLRMTAQLIESETGHHVWAERIDRPDEDLFEIQDEFTRIVVASVQTRLILSEARRNNVKRYDHTSEGLADTRALAEKALQQDPSNGVAARIIATTTWHQIYMGHIPWDPQTVAQMTAYAKRAVEYSPGDEHAYWAMAFAHLFMTEHEQAVVSLRRSLQINPNFSLGFGTLGTVLAWAGKSDESISNNEIALRINPRCPSLFFRHFGLALAHYLARRYTEGLHHASEIMQLRPEWWLGRLIYAACLAKSNRSTEAKRTIAQLKRERPDLVVQALGMLPFSKTTDREHFFEGLQLAGLSNA